MTFLPACSTNGSKHSKLEAIPRTLVTAAFPTTKTKNSIANSLGSKIQKFQDSMKWHEMDLHEKMTTDRGIHLTFTLT
jgi:hypothetical protein